MGNSAIKQHIDTAQKTGACQLCKLGLKEFPEDLERLTKNLRTLDLSDNKIPVLPRKIGGFVHLKNIIMNSNRLSSLPEEFGNLKKLESLSIENNLLIALPASFSGFTHLTTITLAHNRLRTFPVQICGLKKLNAVDLSHNAISEIPNKMNDFHSIELNLNQNQISTLPETMSQCPRLKVLRLEENCLEITAFSSNLLRKSQIALLAIEGNVFDMKFVRDLDGYDVYMERYTATKKKFN